jgi:hypothetical protein
MGHKTSMIQRTRIGRRGRVTPHRTAVGAGGQWAAYLAKRDIERWGATGIVLRRTAKCLWRLSRCVVDRELIAMSVEGYLAMPSLLLAGLIENGQRSPAWYAATAGWMATVTCPSRT